MNIYLVTSYLKKLNKILLRIVLGALLVLPVYFFYQPSINILNTIIYNPFYIYTEQLELWLYLVLYFSIISFINVFVLFFLSVYFDYKREKTSKRRLRYEKFFTERITEYLLSNEYDNEGKTDEFASHLKPFTKKRIQVEALFSTYTKIQETLALNLSEKFKILLKKLDIYEKQKAFLYSNNNDERMIAMKMLSYLRIHDFKDRIGLYAKSKNHALRTEAFAALIRLMEKDNVLVKFIGMQYNLSLLDINVVFNAVLKNFKTEIDYDTLLKSALERKTIIGALLVKFRNLKEYNEHLINHIASDNNNILLRQMVWDAFLETASKTKAIEMINTHLLNEPDDVQQVILEKANEFNDKSLNENLVANIEQFSLLSKIEALKALFRNDVNRFIDFKYSENSETIKAFNEVSDININ